MALEDFASLIDSSASRFRIDPKVLRAVILTESRGDPWSCKYEPTYPYLVNPRDWADKLIISFDTEVALQRTSMGLMHPMGGVCREYGFSDILSQIFRPELSLQYGCTHLQKKAEKYGSDPATMYAAYNAGSLRKTPGGLWVNQSNVDRFMTHFRELTA